MSYVDKVVILASARNLLDELPTCQVGACRKPWVGFVGSPAREPGSRSTPACLEHADWQPCPWNDKDGGRMSRAVSLAVMCLGWTS